MSCTEFLLLFLASFIIFIIIDNIQNLLVILCLNQYQLVRFWLPWSAVCCRWLILRKCTCIILLGYIPFMHGLNLPQHCQIFSYLLVLLKLYAYTMYNVKASFSFLFFSEMENKENWDHQGGELEIINRQAVVDRHIIYKHIDNRSQKN